MVGIEVCERWRESFVNFLEDMGECPKGLTIDRIENTKGYGPENCRWATRKENQRNRNASLLWTINGKAYETAQIAANAHGVCSATIAAWCKGRIANGRRYARKPECSVSFKRNGKELVVVR